MLMLSLSLSLYDEYLEVLGRNQHDQIDIDSIVYVLQSNVDILALVMAFARARYEAYVAASISAVRARPEAPELAPL
jgi:hypothetical protein